MLKSYEAIIENGHVKWLSDTPAIKSARIIVTIIEEKTPGAKRRIPPAHLAGKVKILGDIVSPIVGEEEWGCLK